MKNKWFLINHLKNRDYFFTSKKKEHKLYFLNLCLFTNEANYKYMTKLVIVESPAKAKTIGKYLGQEYDVIASYGHVRDLPSKQGSVKPDDNFSMIWQSNDRATKQVKELTKRIKKSTELYLATDPDREGEAISWHILNIFNDKKLLENKNVKRVVFNEITVNSVKNAFKSPRDINQNLVDAYLARLSLDYLVGFTLSPILWRKLPGAKSAGRVQSVALRLIVEREREIDAFNIEEYWSITAKCIEKRKKFQSRLTHFNKEKLEKISIQNESHASEIVSELKNNHKYIVSSIDRKQGKRHPTAPFITSTMQQEASRKAGFGATRTMRVAQQLYEGIKIGGEVTGLITYMRTDSVHIAKEAMASLRLHIKESYGDKYLSSSERTFKTKAKNAQEAHEAIRPTDFSLTPEKASQYLDKDQLKLYSLVWKRAVASQMESAVFDKTKVIISDENSNHKFQSNGSIIIFDGFLKLYQEGQDDVADSDEESRLPNLTEGQEINIEDILKEQHFTQPPPRYTEASLVKSLEELSIGRPSTYASILNVLKTRNYVVLEKKRFVPEDRGKLVTSFLENFFSQYVQYNFTADLEGKLDDISDGEIFYKDVLRDFWTNFDETVSKVSEKTITDVIALIEEDMKNSIFPVDEKGEINKKCPTCKEGELGLRLSKFGAFVGCNAYPECKYTKKIQGDESASAEAVEIGKDPETDETIFIKRGPYGPYLQWGDGEKPKRANIPPSIPVETVTIEKAMFLKSLPKTIGNHPETDIVIQVGIGRYGPFIKYNNKYISIPKTDSIDTITVERSAELIVLREERDEKRALKNAERGIVTTVKNKPSAKKSASKKTTVKKTTVKKTSVKKSKSNK